MQKMMHGEFLDHVGSNNSSFVIVKPGGFSGDPEEIIKLGRSLVAIERLISYKYGYTNFSFMPGAYDKKNLDDFFDAYRNISALNVSDAWICGYLQLIADSLVYLRVDAAKAVKLPEVDFPRLNRLNGRKLRFMSSQFPQLEHLSLTNDRLNSAEIDKIAQLKTLNLINYSEDNAIDFGTKNQLSFLGLRGGRYSNLLSLSALPSLRGLWLQDIKASLDLSQLIPSNIKELTIGYCSELKNLDELVRSGKLESIQIFGCKGTNNTNIKPFLDSFIQNVSFY